ncbi:hypothetical protein F53441_13552 [Fusarium austroafricanum]|uniref:Cell wall protein n=1 Tax=Fusarium austroafricanum TaxID=2364996 RepID=A0A8H4NQM8_9HYPO|nr:hypothetical protein F53441_13552 [Fusarium austroafricanum]
MRPSILYSLALGLANLDAAVAMSGPSSVESVAKLATSSFTLPEATSATFASTTAEAVTTDDKVTKTTTVAESVPTIEATITEIVTSQPSAEATTETTASSGAVSASSGSAIATTSATPSSTILPMFRLIAQGGPAANQPLLADREGYAILLFTAGQGDFTDAYFSVDPVTHYLLLDNEQPICGYFGDASDSGFANLVRCSDGPTMEEEKITCEAPTGTYIQCSVAALDCTTQCIRTGDTWSTTYTGEWADNRYDAGLGPASVDGVPQTPFLIEFEP